MKIMMKKQLGIVLLVLFGLTISSCSGGGKYKYNANNGFYVNGGDLNFVRGSEFYELNLSDGESGAIADLSPDIDIKTIFGIHNGNFYMINENKISQSFYGRRTPSGEVELPKTNFDAISFSNDRDFLFIYSNTTIELFQNRGTKFIYANKINIEKKYDSFFCLRSDYQNFTSNKENIYTIGFVKGKKIDLIDIEVKLNGDTEYVVSSKKKGEIMLDKQYDGYVYCIFAYEDEFVRLDPAVYLGCIEENKIKFYDIKRGQFAKIPIKDVEMSWAF